ncbi:MAG: hypothetical protein O7H41_15210 [Planctomycetota bacterium]|nr:hypothetical protein [Planctomycetota bacterium]
MSPGERSPAFREPDAPRDRGPGAGEVKTPAVPVAPFWEDVPRLLGYAFNGRGRAVILAGGLCFGLAWWIGQMSLLGIFLIVPVMGYMSSYAFGVIRSASTGSDQPPDWPDTSDFLQTFVSPFIAMIVLGFAPFAPYFFLRLMDPSDLKDALVIAAQVAGIFLFPMVLLIYCLFHSVVGALRPGFVISSIRKVLPDYLMLFVTLCIGFAAYLAVDGLLGRATGALASSSSRQGSLIHAIGASFLQLYFLMTGSFVIGSLYHQAQGRLGWFEEATEPPKPLRPAVIGAVAGALVVVAVIAAAKIFLSGDSGP